MDHGGEEHLSSIQKEVSRRLSLHTKNIMFISSQSYAYHHENNTLNSESTLAA
jgi:hypothetical protein